MPARERSSTSSSLISNANCRGQDGASRSVPDGVSHSALDMASHRVTNRSPLHPPSAPAPTPSSPSPACSQSKHPRRPHPHHDTHPSSASSEPSSLEYLPEERVEVRQVGHARRGLETLKLAHVQEVVVLDRKRHVPGPVGASDQVGVARLGPITRDLAHEGVRVRIIALVLHPQRRLAPEIGAVPLLVRLVRVIIVVVVPIELNELLGVDAHVQPVGVVVILVPVPVLVLAVDPLVDPPPLALGHRVREPHPRQLHVDVRVLHDAPQEEMILHVVERDQMPARRVAHCLCVRPHRLEFIRMRLPAQRGVGLRGRVVGAREHVWDALSGRLELTHVRHLKLALTARPELVVRGPRATLLHVHVVLLHAPHPRDRVVVPRLVVDAVVVVFSSSQFEALGRYRLVHAPVPIGLGRLVCPLEVRNVLSRRFRVVGIPQADPR
eukprot:3305105-Rhodomonas_salina.1